MTGDNFWLCLKSVAAELDGGRSESERTLDVLEQQLRLHSRQERHRIREQITLIVSQLSRLEMRLLESDGAREEY